jgi:hypothetical protein
MLAKIYQPSKTAMQSGSAKTRGWIVEFVPEAGKTLDPLMGWTGSSDMNGQVQLRFESREAAVAYAERHGIAYQLFQPRARRHILRPGGYGDNFATQRRTAWTH